MNRWFLTSRASAVRGWTLLLAAILAASAAAQQPAPSFETLSRQAEAARDAKHLDQALSLYRQALKLRPNWDEGLWNLGSIAYDLDRFADCAPAFHRLASVKPDSAPAWTMGGLCEYRLRRFDAASESFEHVEKLEFQEPPELARAARMHFALVLNRLGSFEKAIAVLTDMTRINHRAPDIEVASGIAGLRRAWLPAEVPEAGRSLVRQLGDAMVAVMEMDQQGAVLKFEAVEQAFPEEPNVHFRFGGLLMQQDPDRGIAEIQKTLSIAPDHVLALMSLSAIYLKREDPKAAVDFGERAVQAGPRDFATHLTLGRALLAADNPERAVSELEAAVRLAPASADARYSLASAYSRVGRKADAAREHEEFKRLQNSAK